MADDAIEFAVSKAVFAVQNLGGNYDHDTRRGSVNVDLFPEERPPVQAALDRDPEALRTLRLRLAHQLHKLSTAFVTIELAFRGIRDASGKDPLVIEVPAKVL